MDKNALTFTTSAIGRNVAYLRHKRGLTLAGLAELSGVSKASISAIENGKNNPTIDTLWNIAVALGMEFGELVGPDLDKAVFNEDGLNVRLIDRQFNDRHIEVYVIELPPDTCRQAEAHSTGVHEHILVIAGELMTGPKAEPVLVRAGQFTQFTADQPHLYQAGLQACRAIVTIIYPRSELNLTEFDQILPWPHDTSQDAWQVVYDLLCRARTEVQNGRLLTRLIFRNAPKANELELASLHKAMTAIPSCPDDSARVYICSHPVPAFATLYRSVQMRPLPRGKNLDGELIETCRTLADMALNPTLKLRSGDKPKLKLQASSISSTIIESALAAEVLTRSGDPTVPASVCSNTAIRTNDEVSDGERLFEHRIDVDAYNAYELIHPAYARQVLAAAELLPSMDGNKEKLRLLDIGTGPGLPLQMLLELRPELLVTAVDPSETAYNHFKARFANDSRVNAIKASITEYRPETSLFDAAISIGASHHLDTVDFLKSIRSCLSPRASLVICDEMIAPFKDTQDRARNLIIHHLWYILDTLASLPPEADQNDRALSHLLNNRLPSVMVLATAGRVGEAQQLLRKTYEAASEIKTADFISTPLAAFSRFHMLELQALVAGLDYEVEQKTSAMRFIALAEAHGFNLLEQHRIYATAGDGVLDAGTHAYLFEAQY